VQPAQPEPAAQAPAQAPAQPKPAQPASETAAQAPATEQADDKPPASETPDDKPPPSGTADDDVKPPASGTAEGEGGGGLGGSDLLGLAGLGYGIYEEAESKDTTGAKVANIAGQVGLFAGIEAAEMAVPGAGPVLGALTAVGFGLYDIFSKKHKDDANPAPVKGPPPVVAPTMSFDSAPTLDSSSFRQPLGGIVQ
jgi:hypothetical protein